jgi:hypothetical protein
MTKSSQFKMTRFEDEARVFRDLARFVLLRGLNEFKVSKNAPYSKALNYLP